MDQLADAERRKYRAVWENDQYRVVSPGARHLGSALGLLRPRAGSSFTDWGCGTGVVAEELRRRGFEVRLVDIAHNAYKGDLPFTEACLWDLPAELPASDYGYCADVMEHIPTERVDAVFAGIAQRTLRACYFQIALFHDTSFTANGPLHLTVQPDSWWLEQTAKHFTVGEVHRIRAKHLLVLATATTRQ